MQAGDPHAAQGTVASRRSYIRALEVRSCRQHKGKPAGIAAITIKISA